MGWFNYNKTLIVYNYYKLKQSLKTLLNSYKLY